MSIEAGRIELVIRGGAIATEDGIVQADIGISDGVIVQIGQVPAGQQELDASHLLVLPGGIDAHVHLSTPPSWRSEGPVWVDDFTSGSAAALAGGITSLGNMTFPEEG